MRRLSTFASVAFSLMFLILAVPSAHAVIKGIIYADIHHPFVVDNTTLPPGRYMFRMVPGNLLNYMTVANDKGEIKAKFLVQPSYLPKTPSHAELIFNRYGKTEILEKIFQKDDSRGEALQGVSSEEAQLRKEGKKPLQHMEEQQS